VHLVRAVGGPEAPLFRMETEAPASACEPAASSGGDSVIIDFEGHRTGYLSFRLATEGRETDALFACASLSVKGSDGCRRAFLSIQGCELSEGWLPDEVINVDYLPQAVRCRVVRVPLREDRGAGYLTRIQNPFEDLKAHAVTSARGVPAPLTGNAAHAARIDAVSLATLATARNHVRRWTAP
jgi:hypothetical protein